LVDELQQRYDVPRRTGQAWVDADQVLPLLDGLDEVQAEYRAACVDAINTFRRDHGLLPLAVCSRVADYKALGTPLRLQGAVVVQPLTRAQVETYVERIEPSAAALHEALWEDPTLWELLDTPLMLSVGTAAYASAPVEALNTHETVAARRQHLLAAYVAWMFQRRSAVTRYTRQQTERWLAWLAWQLAQHSQTVFYLERMQPDWVPPEQRWWPTVGIGVVCGLLFGLLGGLGAELLFGLAPGLFFGLGGGLAIGLFGYSTNIHTVETSGWSWSAVWSGLPFMLGMGLFFGLGGGLATGLAGGLAGGLATGLASGLYKGLSRGERTTKTVPNEGIHRSAWHALFVGLLGGLGTGLATGLAGEPSLGLLSGLGAGLLFGLDYGGRSCLQHLMLRLILVRHGAAPWRYAAFLDHAAERLFLQRVGGGYMFIHRLLQDYFASLHTEPRDAANRDAPG
jgi:hypothetical protein